MKQREREKNIASKIEKNASRMTHFVALDGAFGDNALKFMINFHFILTLHSLF